MGEVTFMTWDWRLWVDGQAGQPCNNRAVLNSVARAKYICLGRFDQWTTMRLMKRLARTNGLIGSVIDYQKHISRHFLVNHLTDFFRVLPL
jgi:hypothetical protein